MQRNPENHPDMGMSKALHALQLEDEWWCPHKQVPRLGMEKLFLIFHRVFSPQSLESSSTADYSGGPHLPTATDYNPGD